MSIKSCRPYRESCTIKNILVSLEAFLEGVPKHQLTIVDSLVNRNIASKVPAQ